MAYSREPCRTQQFAPASPIDSRLFIISAFFGDSVTLAGMSLIVDSYMTLIVLFLVGMFSGLINIYVLTIFQTQTPRRDVITLVFCAVLA